MKRKTTKARWRPKKEPGRMNQTEKRFEQNVLWARQLAGEVSHWWYETLKFRLADNTFYTPDFVVFMPDGSIECIDVKGSGGWEQHTRIKMKVAAEQFPEFAWFGYEESKGRRGEFHSEEF